MKNLIIAFTLLVSFLGFSQTGKIYPKNKKINRGEINTYIYEPPAGLEIPENALALGQSDSFNLVSSPLIKNNNQYEFLMKFSVTDDLFLVKIINGKGHHIDYDNNNGYLIKLNPKLSKEHTILKEAPIWLFTNHLSKEVRFQKQIDMYEQAFNANPNLKKKYAYSDYLNLRFELKPEETKSDIIKHIEYLKKNTSDEGNLYYLSAFYSALGMHDDGEKTKEILLKKFPKGNHAKNNFFEKYYSESNKTESFILNKENEYFSIFGNDSKEESFQLDLLSLFLKQKEIEKMNSVEQRINNKISVAHQFNDYAWQLADENITSSGTDLDFAESLSKKSLEIVRYKIENPDYSSYSIGLNRNYNMFADTYALIMYKQKRYQEAFDYQHPIVEQDELDTGGKERYAAYAEKAKGLEFTKNYIEKELDRGTNSKLLTEQLERIYQELNLPKETLEAKKQQLKKLVTENAKKEVLKLYGDVKAPDFELENLEGKKVKLSDYKGKMVVLDFWATWCGPCRSSFPNMQKLVNEYKAYNVEFFFIDTREGNQHEKTKNKVTEFIKEHQYTFNVLYDFDSEIAKKYIVRGIPAKIVIDKEGNIISVDSSEENIKALIEENK